VAVVAYKCPGCGAGISFNAEKQKFVCEYCLSEYTEEEFSAVPTSSAESDFGKDLLSYVCNNCGAEVFADRDTVSDFCPYCHNPVICEGRLTGQLQPHKIIPFAFDKAEAEKRFLEFAKKKKFVPKDFFAPDQVDKIRGIYYPFWLTDADVTASGSAKAEQIRTWKVGKNLYTETSHFTLFRKGAIHFEDVTTGAFTGEDKAMLEGILPFPSEALQPFSMPFLSGFLAKKRNVEKDEILGSVKGRIEEYSSTMLRNTMTGYTAVHPSGTQVDMDKLQWEYTLLPIWILTYHKGGKTYIYALNGYTGKVYGEVPISGKKLLLLFLAILLGVTLLGTIGGLLL